MRGGSLQLRTKQWCWVGWAWINGGGTWYSVGRINVLEKERIQPVFSQTALLLYFCSPLSLQYCWNPHFGRQTERSRKPFSFVADKMMVLASTAPQRMHIIVLTDYYVYSSFRNTIIWVAKYRKLGLSCCIRYQWHYISNIRWLEIKYSMWKLLEWKSISVMMIHW